MNPPAPARRSFPWMNLFLGLFALLIVIGTAIAIWPVDNSLTVSPQTTVITAPLAADGLPDYVAYFNQENSRGVLPKENVYIDILQAMGMTEYEPAEIPLVMQLLGMPAMPQGPFLVDASYWDVEKVPPQYRPAISPYLGTWDNVFGYKGAAPFDPDHPELFDAAKSKREFFDILGLCKHLPLPPSRLDPQTIRALQKAELEWQLNNMEGPWVAADSPYTASLLAQNEAILDRLAAALEQKTGYFVPIVPDPTDPSKNNLQSRPFIAIQLKRRLMLNYGLRLRYRVGNHDLPGALADWKTMLRIARLRQRQCFLVDDLVDIACLGIHAANTRYFMQHPPMERSIAQALLDELNHLPNSLNCQQTIDKGERLFGISIVVDLAQQAQAQGSARGIELLGKDKLSLHPDFDWNHVTKRLNQDYDQTVRAINLADYQKTTAELKNISQTFSGKARIAIHNLAPPWGFFATRAARSEALGIFLSAQLLPATQMALNAYYRQECRLNMMKLCLALDLHHRDQGHYPARLADLAPRYLPQVPLDPYMQKDFIYRVNGNSYLCYSVGPNLVDDGGIQNWNDPNYDGQPTDHAIGTPDQVPTRFLFEW